ncbi:proton-coupled amino acid transporter-like protein CG1139 [Culicoides brevitarsis]|uniref:proton-coupled amino acid transporter-like protein CG1139 n=1 Tax=Culicoides brevitarsis TaxID=469753 RepID=UPI00307BA0BF
MGSVNRQQDIEMRSKSDKNKEFDPYENRTLAKPITNSETLFHLLKGSLGTGILAMPNAFHNAGWLVGSVGTIFIGFVCTYAIHVLIAAEYEVCKRKKIGSLTYTKLAELSLSDGPPLCKKLAPYIATIINIFLIVYQLGTCCVYVVFVSSNIKSIAEFYVGEEVEIRVIMLIILLPLIFINWIRNLKLLAPFSTFANFVTLITFGIIAYYIFKDPLTLEGKEVAGELKRFPLFFGTVLFALEAIGVILPLENEMKTPKAFVTKCGVLNVSMIFIVILYVGMGLFGYIAYGEHVQGSITLNLPSHEILSQIVKGSLAFAIFITHALACYVAIDIVWGGLKSDKNQSHQLLKEYATRTILVLITFGLAVAIPNLELFISLFGSLCLSFLGLVAPAMIDMAVFWGDFGTCNWKLWRNIFLIVFGLCGLITGTYTSLLEIIHTYF